MEHKVRLVEPEHLMPQLPQLLQEVESVPLIISGNSMAPFLTHGRDTVYLSRLTQPPKRGDMVLYRRDCGQYILHRVFRQREGVYEMIGDGQLVVEPGIRADQIIAIVKTVRRKGKLLRKGSFCWAFFARVWLALVPARPVITRMHRFMTAWRKRK
jgi:hypothetical protein